MADENEKKSVEQPPELTDEDETILDRVWAEIAREEAEKAKPPVK